MLEPKRKETADLAGETASELQLGQLRDLISFQLRRAQLSVFQRFMAELGSQGVTPGRFGLLTVISENPGSSQTALAEALSVDRSTMVAMIDKLEVLGWVERARSELDRRSHAILLTEAGKKILQDSWQQITALEDEVCDQLSGAERKQLIRLLDRITKE